MSRRWHAVRPEEIAPDDPDYLLNRFLPKLRPHIINNYAWMERRGNCLTTVEDLTQLAAIAMMKLIDDWPGIIRGVDTTRDTDPLFWHILKDRVKKDLYKHLDRKGTDPVTVDLSFEYEGEQIERPDLYEGSGDETHDRTGIRRRPDGTHWHAVYADVMDFWDRLAPVDKTQIALRYFDGLPMEQVSALSGRDAKGRTAMYRVLERWRAHARNQFADHAEDVEPRKPRPWEPPEALVEYLRARHGKDLHEYLGVVTLCFRADSDYVAEALDLMPTYKGGGRAKVSGETIAAIDRMAAEGYNGNQIADALGLARSGVYYRLSRRAA